MSTDTVEDWVERSGEDMASSQDLIVEMNKLGYVTCNGQVGSKDRGDDGHVTWQRAYLSGFMSEAVAEKLMIAST